MSTTVELKLSRPSRIYRPSDPLEGKIVVKSASSFSHYGIGMVLKGSVNLQVRGGSAGVIESFYGVVKPIIIRSKILEIKPSGKIVSGTTELLHILTSITSCSASSSLLPLFIAALFLSLFSTFYHLQIVRF